MSSGLQVKLYECAQAHLTTEPISLVEGSGQFCSAETPAALPVTSLKIHYFLHYMQRGRLERFMTAPTLPGEAEADVEHYRCNLCNKKFFNVPAKNDFSGKRHLCLPSNLDFVFTLASCRLKVAAP